ncbi:hypothetical protein DL768_006829 [Monosporascus sp. mg162]|nr:hypothetical protein DL768_006829 [Monosporascus sp. mg162]
MDTAFHASSPLALNVLFRVKELGFESYVLGVVDALYNELLEVYSSRYGNLPGMLDLLEEMRHCGLYFDDQISSILGRAQAAVRNLAEDRSTGSLGIRLQMAKWKLPPSTIPIRSPPDTNLDLAP